MPEYITITGGGITVAMTRDAIPVDATVIDAAWLTTNGPAPYHLATPNAYYALATDVTTDGTAFAIIATDVTLNLNGHTITYNNAAPILIANNSFESGSGASADNWDFTNAPHGERYAGVWLDNEIYDGSYSLKLSGFVGEQYVENDTQITLLPNTKYSLSAMFFNPTWVAGESLYVKLIGQNGAPDRIVSRADNNWRGIQFTEATFTTGGTAETYIVRAGAVATTTGYIGYIDNLLICQTQNYGVAVSAHSWNPDPHPGVTSYGRGTNATIAGGTIIQGQNSGTWCHGVFNYSTANTTVRRNTITVAGPNSAPLQGQDSTSWAIIDNDLTSNVLTITSRDHFNGAVINDVGGVIVRNRIHNGPHAGIIAGRGDSLVKYNTIRLRTRYTNAFGIIASNASEVCYNTILCGDGEYTARGIMAGGNNTGRMQHVHHNTIEVQALATNQEYGGTIIGGAYGIQVESGTNTEINDNVVTAYAHENEAHAFRANGPTSNIYVHDNVFEAVRTGAGLRASAIKLSAVTDGGLQFEDNTLKTNKHFVGDSYDCDNFEIIRPTIETTGDLTGFLAVEANGWAVFNDGLHVAGLRFIDPAYYDATSEANLTNAETRTSGGTLDSGSNISRAWTTVIEVHDATNQPISGATVSITNTLDATVFSGTTDSNGQCTAVLDEFTTAGDTKTTFSPYTVQATSGFLSGEVTFNATSTQTITVIASEAMPDGAIAIDAAWLTANGPAPYILDQTDAYYYLQTDVTVDETAFVVAATGVTLNLNGRTVTFANGDIPIVTNGDFETGSGTTVPGWDISGAPSAALAANTTYFPGSQLLKFTGLDGTETIVSDPVNIPTANHDYVATIRGKAASGLTPSMTMRVVDNVTDEILGTNTSTSVAAGAGPVVTFTPTTTNAVRLEVDVTVAVAGDVLVNLAGIYRANNWGIVASHSEWYFPTQLSTTRVLNAVSSTPTGFRLIGPGSLSAGKSTYGSSALYMVSSQSCTISDVQISVVGVDIRTISAQYSSGLTIRNCVINHDVPQIINRHDLKAAISIGAAGSVASVIEGNTINNCPQVGIYVSSYAGSGTLKIDNNTIYPNISVTNGYGVLLASCNNWEITNNTISVPVGKSGRGILLDTYGADGGHDNGLVANNTVSIREKPNLEYGITGLSATALRIRGGSVGRNITNLVVRDNTFAATTSATEVIQAIGCRITAYDPTTAYDITLENNTFSAIVETTDTAFSAVGLELATIVAEADLTIVGNTFSSNHIAMQLGGNDGINQADVDFISSTFLKSDSGATRTYTAISGGYWINEIDDVRLIDNTYGAGVTDSVSWRGTGDQTQEITFGWLLDITVKDTATNAIADAEVTITDDLDNVIYAGTTDGAGLCASIIVPTEKRAFTYSGGETITDYTPHSIQITKAGFSTFNLSVTLDQSAALDVNLEASTYTLN